MKIKIPLIIVAIEDEGFHPHIHIEINSIPAILLVDTGASKTVFDSHSINDYINDIQITMHDKLTTGLGTNSMISHKAIISKIAIGEIELLSYDAVLIDLSHVNESYECLGLPKIAGVLGSDLLMQFKGVVDFNKKELMLTLKANSF
ncbi:MAG: aspartyl protease family protein [Bacteroidetes bacterium]|nr:aspartyl protease family protein [Bacteroidota bacterium]HET6245270.1 aspartyl protease family protein [Bacteroidia bacterium]